MTNQQLIVLKGLIELPSNEREEVIRKAQEYETKTFSEKESWVTESYKNMGPINSMVCPRCGK